MNGVKFLFVFVDEIDAGKVLLWVHDLRVEKGEESES